MIIQDIVDFWKGQQSRDERGRWTHRLDRETLTGNPHTFNLDYPVSPFVGDVLRAPVLILGANAGYSGALTPTEFRSPEEFEAYLARVDDPSAADWSFVSRYYDKTNYGDLVASGEAALVNACAYRSPRISQEPENQKLAERLPSVQFTRKWLLDAVIPACRTGKRLVVAKRPGLWRLPPDLSEPDGVARDPAPVSPYITGVPFAKMNAFLRQQAA